MAVAHGRPDLQWGIVPAHIDLTGPIRFKLLESSNLDEKSRDGKKDLYPRAGGGLTTTTRDAHSALGYRPPALQTIFHSVLGVRWRRISSRAD